MGEFVKIMLIEGLRKEISFSFKINEEGVTPDENKFQAN